MRLDDVISELMMPDEMLGLDHINKARTPSGKGDSIFIR